MEIPFFTAFVSLCMVVAKVILPLHHHLRHHSRRCPWYSHTLCRPQCQHHQAYLLIQIQGFLLELPPERVNSSLPSVRKNTILMAYSYLIYEGIISST